MQITRRKSISPLLAAWACMLAPGISPGAQSPGTQEAIKSYCIDFNWDFGRKAGFAKPGKWADADPAKHVQWYKDMGANVIQTFAVSCNGHAWYKNGLVPEQPGLKHDFLTEVVKKGHAEGMKVMGYFCIAANTRWGKENPELSYGTPSSYHIPYTDEYLAYLSSAITDAVKTTGMDGFMIDWFWMPDRNETNGKWIEAEKKLYQQLMGEPFPGEEQLTKDQELAYGRKAIDRCWKAIRKAAKNADPDTIVWLTSNHVHSKLVIDSDLYKEVDWFMGETGKLDEILKVKPMLGGHTRLITCMSDFGGNNAAKDVPAAIDAGIGVYGYAKPHQDSRESTIDLEKIFARQLTELKGNDLRIAIMSRAYRGKAMDTVWKNGEFVQPEQPLPFQFAFMSRSSRHWPDLGRIDVVDRGAILQLESPHQCGRALLTRSGNSWPPSLTVRIAPVKGKPSPNEFRIANGKIGIGVSRREQVEVVAGKMEEAIILGKPWRETFLNRGKPEAPLDIHSVQLSVVGGFFEISIPSRIMAGNPGSICIEWSAEGKVF